MDNTLTVNPTAEETAKIEAEIVHFFAQMDRIDERIAKDQEEIERRQVKLRAKLASLRTI